MRPSTVADAFANSIDFTVARELALEKGKAMNTNEFSALKTIVDQLKRLTESQSTQSTLDGLGIADWTNIKKARKIFPDTDQVKVDDWAVQSKVPGGTWVQAWIFVAEDSE